MYLVFDEETENHTSHKRKANPWHPDNYVVLRGWKKEGDRRCSAERFESKAEVRPMQIDPDVTVLVGHNIKFDLHYEMCIPGGRENLMAFFKRGGRVWCTQYAEYLLQAQHEKAQMCSMDSIVESYGGRLKTDGIKAMWDAGILTSQIDPDLLLDYLIGTEEEGRNSGDIGNTERIYLGQVQAAKELGMYQSMLLRMDGLCATTEMEFNGLKVHVPTAKANLRELQTELDEVEAELATYIDFIPEEVQFSWSSPVHKSCLIFGGTIKYQKSDTYLDEATGELARKWETREEFVQEDGSTHPTQPGVRYQSGKKKGEFKTKKVKFKGELKTKIQDFFYTLDGFTKPDPDWKSKLTDGHGGPVYGTGSDVMDIITKRDIGFLKAMGRKLALDKEIGTYYVRYDEKKKTHVGMLTCVQKSDHIVHHNLNHTNTKTTRLSANNPNMQNVPRGDKSKVKAMFVSRFGDDGEMIEADYSQLEVVVQGVLSLDENLCNDLRNKIDFHCKRVALKCSVSYDFALFHCKDEDAPDHAKWKSERTKAKIFSFQRAYGAGAALIAAETGMDIEEVKALIEAEEKEYPGVVKFNNAVEKEVNATAEPFRDGARGWRVFRRGTWQAPTGTIYSWRSYDAPAFLRSKGITDTFKPTELKNYPVQGTGGEIVQIILGLLWRWFVKTDNFDGKALLVNTVHDCVWADSHKDVRDRVCHGIKVIMESVPKVLKHYFGMECPVPFPVEVEAGPNMLDLHHVL